MKTKTVCVVVVVVAWLAGWLACWLASVEKHSQLAFSTTILNNT